MNKRILSLVMFMVFCVAATVRAEQVQVALINPVQLYPEDRVINVFRLDLIVGVNAGMSGLDLGIVNVTKDKFDGLAIGIVHDVGGNMNGWQIGAGSIAGGDSMGIQNGLIVSNGGSFSGWQGSGLVSYNGGIFSGVQTSIANIIGGEGKDAFDLGAVNYTVGNFRGLELGVYNRAADTEGLQLGGFNSAQSMNGVQIGAINVTDSLSGLQIGLINYNGKRESYKFLPIVSASF